MKKIEKFTLEDKVGRLRYLRHLTGLSRTQVYKKHGIPAITLKKWETGAFPLTKKGIERCLEAYAKESIYSSSQWIEEGIGPVPSLDLGIKDNCLLSGDLEFFKNTYPNAIIHEVKDNNMYPRYKKGETVIGIIHRGKLSSIHEKDCIVELSDKTRFIKRVSLYKDKIFLLSINNDFTKDSSVIDGASIEFIAPIKWLKVINI